MRPACLPLKKAITKDITGIEMIAAGWGKTNDCKFIKIFFNYSYPSIFLKKNYEFLASSISPVLNKLKVKVVSNDECQLSFGNIVHETTLCSVGIADKTGTCQVRILTKTNYFIHCNFDKSS